MSIRPLSSTLKSALSQNEPYITAHLVKFEKPTLNPNYSGVSARKATDYAYITDAPYNIDFDDGSYSRQEERQLEADEFNNVSPSSATPNGVQTYFANKVLSVGTINEGIEAKSSNLSLKLDSSALGSLVSTKVTFNASQDMIETDVDLSEHGFSEGDTIYFSGGTQGATNNDGASLRIDGFTSQGVKVTRVGGSWFTESNKRYSISLASEEIATLILGNGSVSYTNYINREVTIYRIHIDPETKDVIGGLPSFDLDDYSLNGALLLFKGIITGASLNENPNKSSELTWALTSHWGDFIRVQNRVTDDESHRSLDVNGYPDYNMLIRPEYATDYGFEHAGRSINLIGTYNRTETRVKLKKKKKNLGLSKKYTMEEYTVQVPTDVDLAINMHSKNLPVVYGVQKVDSIPVFFDNLSTKPGQIYVIYAIAEGKMGGILDVVIDDKGLICVDSNDEQARSSQNTSNTVDILCEGRQDRGDVLEGGDARQGVGLYTTHIYEYDKPKWKRGQGWTGLTNAPHYSTVTTSIDVGGVGSKGILHEHAYRIEAPIEGTFIYHQGKKSQRANDLLVEKASKNLFKIQNDFYDGVKYNYFTPNHRLLDTAYVVAEYLIAEGEASLPSVDFVVRGKEIECYNYDQSYDHSAAYPAESAAAFNAGDQVQITVDGNLVSSTATIIDKFLLVNADGEDTYRFRWDVDIPETAKVIVMSNGTHTWNMLGADKLLRVGTIPAELSAAVSQYTTVNGNAGIKFTTSSLGAGMKGAMEAQDQYLRNGVQVTETTAQITPYSLQTTGNNGALQLHYKNISDVGQETVIDEIPGVETLDITKEERVSLVNAVQLPVANPQVTDNRYVGSTITVIRYDSNNVPYTQVREITKWIATNSYSIAFVDQQWDPGYIPTTGDSFQIRSPKDKRISLNPAMQLLDYMKSKRYGKGLDDDDIDLPTFQAAARSCDTRSDVTLFWPTSGLTVDPTVGAVYKYTNNARVHWQGTIKSIKPITIDSVNYHEVTFTDCIGKLLSKWQDYRAYAAGAILWNFTVSGGLQLKEATGGAVSDLSTLSNVTAVNLTKVSGTGDSSVGIDIGTLGRSADGNPIIKKSTTAGDVSASGYSLYDSDNIKYWKYVGWDNASQRNVTRHQFNQTIDTSNTVFDNINGMLKQFNGILRYSSGKYQLRIKSASDTLLPEEKITESDIVGTIKLSDKGSKKTYNSVSASIIDPANNFEPRSVSFFNSNYLKQDNGVPKKGSFTTPSVTNYYNARVGIQQFLDESRNGLEIQFTVRPSGALLLAGEIIALDYPRFGWEGKLWRIINLNFLNTGLVSVTAEEHSDNVYLVGPSDEDSQTSIRLGQITPSVTSISQIPDAPYSLLATQNLDSAIKLTWKHPESYNANTHSTAIYRNTINVRSTVKTATNAGTEATVLTMSDTSNLAAGMVASGVSTDFTVPSGSFTPGIPAKIKTLGDNNWNDIAGTTNVEYEVGDLITPAAGKTGLVSETGELTTLKQTLTIASVDSATQVTLSAEATWALGNNITFTAPQIRVEKGVDTYMDNLSGPGAELSYYYWIQYEVVRPTNTISGQSTKIVTSNFHPSTNTGVLGKGKTPIYALPRSIDVALSNSGHFLYNSDGLQIENTIGSYPTSTGLTATSGNTLGTVTYKFEVFDNSGTIINALTTTNSTGLFTYNAPVHASDRLQALDALPQSVKVTLTDTVGTDTFTATETIGFTASRVLVDGDPGDSAIDIEISNNNHTFATDGDDAAILTGSGTDIRIYEGANEMTFVDTVSVQTNVTSVVDTYTYTIISQGNMQGSDWQAIGATNTGNGNTFVASGAATFFANNPGKTALVEYNGQPFSTTQIGSSEFFIDVTAPTGVTIAAGGLNKPVGLKLARMPDYTAFTVDNAQVTFSITGKRATGGSFTRSIKQNLTRSLNGKSLRLNSSTYGVEYTSAGQIASPTTITLSWDTFGINTADVHYKITRVPQGLSPVVVNQLGNSTTYSFSAPNSAANTPIEIEVEAIEGTTFNPVSPVSLAKDSITIVSVKDAQAIAINASAASFIFEATDTGSTTNDFQSTVGVTVGGVSYAYDAGTTTGGTTYTRNSGNSIPSTLSQSFEVQTLNANDAWERQGVSAIATDDISPPVDVTGGSDAEKFTASTVSALHRLVIDETQWNPDPNSALMNWSVYVKAGTHSRVYLTIGHQFYAWTNVFDLSNGTVASNQSGSTAVISNEGNGWYRISMSLTNNSYGGGQYVAVGAAQASNNATYWAPSGTVDFYLWGARLTASNTLTNYYNTTSTPVTTTYGANTFRFGNFVSATNCTPQVAADGTITIANSGIVTSSPPFSSGDLEASFAVPVIDNSNDIQLGTFPYFLRKVLSLETTFSYSFDTTNAQISSTEVTDWNDGSSTLSNNTCDQVVAAVLADSESGGKLIPGDKIALVNGSIVAERIYKGPRRTSSNSTGSGDAEWSSKVVQTINGSAIVEGTLDANTLTANSTFTQTLNVASTLVIGNYSNTGKIYTAGKTSYGGGTAGIYLEGGSNANGKFDVTGTNSHLRFNGTDLEVKTQGGGFTHKSSTSGARVEIQDDKIKIFDGTNERVRIGNLSGF